MIVFGWTVSLMSDIHLVRAVCLTLSLVKCVCNDAVNSITGVLCGIKVAFVFIRERRRPSIHWTRHDRRLSWQLLLIAGFTCVFAVSQIQRCVHKTQWWAEWMRRKHRRFCENSELKFCCFVLCGCWADGPDFDDFYLSFFYACDFFYTHKFDLNKPAWKQWFM